MVSTMCGLSLWTTRSLMSCPLSGPISTVQLQPTSVDTCRPSDRPATSELLLVSPMNGSSLDVGGSPSVSSHSQYQELPPSFEMVIPKVLRTTMKLACVGENRIWLDCGKRPLARAGVAAA